MICLNNVPPDSIHRQPTGDNPPNCQGRLWVTSGSTVHRAWCRINNRPLLSKSIMIWFTDTLTRHSPIKFADWVQFKNYNRSIFQVYRWLARYIYSGQGGYVCACDAREWCLQRTGAVPLKYRHAHRRTDTWPVARRTHLKVPRMHGASTLNVPSLWDFLRAILCVGGTAAARDVRCRYGGYRITFRPQSAAGDAEFET